MVKYFWTVSGLLLFTVAVALVLGTVRVRWCRPQSYYDADAWRGTWAMDGGVLTNQASHHVDLLEWMLGDVEDVFAMSATALVKIDGPLIQRSGKSVINSTSGGWAGAGHGSIEVGRVSTPRDCHAACRLCPVSVASEPLAASDLQKCNARAE